MKTTVASLGVRARAAAPAGADDAVPSPRGAAVHVAISLLAFIVLGVAQLYAFTRMSQSADLGGAQSRVMIAVLASAFLIFTAIALVRQSALMTLAYGGATHAARLRFAEREDWPGLSILVPAHDEAGRIERAIEALLAADYPSLEVIVVDDGSTDDTHARVSRYAGRHGGKRVKVLRKENGGKWSALNLAFHESSEELVVCVDADSQIAPDSLKLLARRLDDPALGGCCGQVVVRNARTLLTRLQSLEYTLLNGLLRQAQSASGTVMVAPGPLAMFRRRVLDQVWKTWGTAQPLPITNPGRRVYGPWEDDTFAEDADLTLNVLLTGHGVVYEPRAISRTSAPEWTFQLLNQRYRWTRGNFQAVSKAWRRWHEAPEAPRLLPVWLCMLLFDTIVWPAVNLFGALAVLTVVAMSGLRAPQVVWFLALTVLDLNEAAFSAKLERSDLRFVTLSLVSRVYYNLLLDVNKFFALYDELRGARMRWS
jgi:cellulose synthase/poly-beta-1,6-N-acetylglucosamine synthase-like glycosyltransferase